MVRSCSARASGNEVVGNTSKTNSTALSTEEVEQPIIAPMPGKGDEDGEWKKVRNGTKSLN